MAEAKNARSLERHSLWGSNYVWLLLGCLLTVLAMLGHQYLPEKRLELVHAATVAYLYSDDQNQVDWVSMEELKWRCEIPNPHREAFCGFQIYLGGDSHQGVDMSHYTHLKLDLEYSGGSSYLRYFFRNHESGFSDPDNMETDKFMQSQIAVDFLASGLTIGLDEFYVAEWWLSDFEVPRKLSGPSFHNVTAVGIDLAYPAAAGDHLAQLHSAELVGEWVAREHWYAGLMAVWIVSLSFLGVVRLVQLRQRVLLERERRTRMAMKNRKLRHESDQFRELSQRDQLTGLLNRHGATAAIERLFSESDTALSLMVVDIDHFKLLNDNYGHDAGDQVLSKLGELLRTSIRQSDFAARWGGEEFVILLPNTLESDAEAIAEKLRVKIGKLTYSALPDKRVTVSMGVGERRVGEAYNELFQRVDRALYRAKETGRNQVCRAS